MFEFKAKRVDNNNWVYGYFFVENSKNYIININNEKFEVIRKTLCIFTGIYDNTKWNSLTDEEKTEFENNNSSQKWNGRKLYENDIIKANSQTSVCEYDRYSGMFHSSNKTFLPLKFEIIGNVFDNTDFLLIDVYGKL